MKIKWKKPSPESKFKWQCTLPLHPCNCGLIFLELKDWVQHKKDTRRWRKYHYRMQVYGGIRLAKRANKGVKE